MPTIKYIEGDLFKAIEGHSETIIIPHVCNNQGAFGSGFVIPLSKAFPKSKESYLKWHSDRSIVPTFSLGQTQFVECENVTVCNMVAQTLGGSRPLRYDALVKCMLKVSSYAIQHKINRIDCPLFGSDRAGGDWNFVEQLIQDCWISRNIQVVVHYLPNFLPNNWNPPNVHD